MKIGKISILLFFAMLLLYVPWTGAVQSESSIVKIDGNEIYINWGSHDGITRGMVFSAYRSKDRSHPSTGEAVDKQEDLMGKIKIFEVFPEYSIGRIVLKVNELRVGDYLELMIDSGGESMEENTQKGAILSMDKGKVEINVGSVDGIQDGLLFDVVRDMALRHPVTGELLERRQYLIGKISVSSVGRSSSVCNVLSGWEDIGVSDEIILSERQRSDMGIDIVKSVSSQPGFAEQELAELLTYEEKPASLPKYFGKISSVNRKAKTAVFSWNKDVDGSGVYQGSQVGLYRKEKVVHPITKAVIGSPEILIGSGSFVRTVKGRGELKILNTETALKKGDIVGIIETRGDVPGVKRTAGTPVGRRVNLRQEAERLTQEVIHIQDDIDELKVLRKRLTSVERGIVSQRKLTNQLKKDVEQINEKLTLLVEGGGASLIPSQTTTMELYGAHPAE
ncbi:hypothetical protein KAS50_08365, partial [bacterium]|nr:hypothetical protein [bacterium]